MAPPGPLRGMHELNPKPGGQDDPFPETVPSRPAGHTSRGDVDVACNCMATVVGCNSTVSQFVEETLSPVMVKS